MRDLRRTRDARSPLVIGLILLVIGAGLLATNLGYTLPFHIWRYWPFVLIVPGLIAIAVPSRHISRSGGVWLLATGVYGAIGVYELFGLGWGSAWPVFVIAAGLAMILDERKRNGRGGPPPQGNA